MNNEAFGAHFGAMTDEEQGIVTGGDAYLAELVGYGLGQIAGAPQALWKWINATSTISGGINVIS